MKALIVDDEFTSRKLLVKILSEYAECDIAVNGKEAVNAFKGALEENQPYDLICMDIKMPEMNGQEALKQIRSIEKEKNIHGYDGVKIIMTTILSDGENIRTAFKEQCESYLVKPIEKEKVVNILNEFGFIK